jgi:hypothetical protein
MIVDRGFRYETFTKTLRRDIEKYEVFDSSLLDQNIRHNFVLNFDYHVQILD